MEEIVDKIKQCNTKYRPMSDLYDLFCEYIILKKHNPKKIMEICAGSAGWALTTNELLNLENLEFVLVEDFRYVSYDGFNWWPQNKNELEQYIKLKNSNFQFHLQDSYTKCYEPQADVLRIDAWGFTYNDLQHWISDCNRSSVILFDDFAFNKDPDLIIMVLELAKNKIIFPIWTSDKVSCWSASNTYSKKIKKHLEQHKDIMKDCLNLTLIRKQYNVLGIYLDIIQTKKPF